MGPILSFGGLLQMVDLWFCWVVFTNLDQVIVSLPETENILLHTQFTLLYCTEISSVEISPHILWYADR